MRSHIKTGISLLAACGVIFTSAAEVCADDEVQRQIITDGLFLEAVDGAVEWERENTGGVTLSDGFVSSGMAGSSEADWFMIAENALGLSDDYSAYVTAAGVPEITDGELLTEPARRNTALALLGGSGCDMSGADLEQAGCNELVWVVLSQRLCGYDDSRALSMLVDMQHKDGGFGLRDSDADVTAMALTVLDGEPADRAEEWLKDHTDGSMSCETASWCIIAACSRGDRAALNDDYADSSGIRPVDVLFACRTEDGGFSHKAGGKAEVISTAQALTALAALTEYDAGGGGIFDGGPADASVRTQTNIAGESEQAVDDMEHIEKLNKKIREEMYPPEDIKLTQLRELISVNNEIETVEPYYRHYVLAAEELAAREKQLKKWSAIGAVFGLLWKLAALIALWRFKHSKLAKRLDEKFRPLSFRRKKKTENEG